MLINENRFIRFEYEETYDLLINVWFEQSEEMTFEEFKFELKEWERHLTEKNAKYAISDTSNLRFNVTPELQDWVVENVNIPLSKNTNFSKHAYIMPKSFIPNLSVEQYFDETELAEDVKSKSRCFSSMEEARHWLVN